MVEWTIATSPYFSVNFIFGIIGLSLPLLIGWYFLRNWKKAFIILLGFLLIGFSITNSPNEQFNILFPIFTMTINGIGIVLIFSQFIPLKRVKKIKIVKLK